MRFIISSFMWDHSVCTVYQHWKSIYIAALFWELFYTYHLPVPESVQYILLPSWNSQLQIDWCLYFGSKFVSHGGGGNWNRTPVACSHSIWCNCITTLNNGLRNYTASFVTEDISGVVFASSGIFSLDLSYCLTRSLL